MNKLIEFIRNVVITDEERKTLLLAPGKDVLLREYALKYEESIDKIDELENAIDELKDNIDELEYSLISIHDSLDSFKTHVDTIQPKPVFYNFGKGRMRVHKVFKNSLNDESIIKSFIKDDLKFDGSLYKDADSLVFSLGLTFSAKYPTVRYYAPERELYGVIEYWASAKETIAKLHKGGKAYECDDVMVLKYSMLYYLLKEFFPSDLWRLRGFIVDLWSGGGHAILGWVKKDINDWVPIETTFRDDSQKYIWANNFTLRDNMFYRIRYSFDENNEYVKI